MFKLLYPFQKVLFSLTDVELNKIFETTQVPEHLRTMSNRYIYITFQSGSGRTIIFTGYHNLTFGC